jgi:hypothetical protein
LIDFGAQKTVISFAHQTKAKIMPGFDAFHAPIQGALSSGARG